MNKTIRYVSSRVEPYAYGGHLMASDGRCTRVLVIGVVHPITGRKFGLKVEYHPSETIVYGPPFVYRTAKKAIVENFNMWDFQDALNKEFVPEAFSRT